MQVIETSRYLNCIRILAALVFLAFSYQSSKAADRVSNETNAFTPPLRIIDTIPQPDAGIINSSRVHDDTSFAVLVESMHGISPIDTGSIRFFISVGDNEYYERNLSSPAVRVVEVENVSSQAALLWAVYDRSLEPVLAPYYGLDTIVQISVDVKDTYGNGLDESIGYYEFKIESDSQQAHAFDHLPESVSYRVDNSDENYGSGIEIVGGPLTGAGILYEDDEPILPAFGPIDEVESAFVSGEQALGMPLNLMPHTVFNHPVKLFIPFPDGTDVTEIAVYYHNGEQWLAACDAEGNLLPGGRGWMVPGSRVDHYENSPPQIEIEVYHFSAAQAVISGSSTTTNNEDRKSNGSGAVVYFSCFIDTAAAGGFDVLSLLSWPASLGLVVCCLLASFAGGAMASRYKIEFSHCQPTIIFRQPL